MDPMEIQNTWPARARVLNPGVFGAPISGKDRRYKAATSQSAAIAWCRRCLVLSEIRGSNVVRLL